MSEEGSPPPEEESPAQAAAREDDAPDEPTPQAPAEEAPEDEPTPAPQAPADAAEFVAPRARPLLGPVLIVSGALLWSYVVMGQLTTSWLSGQAPLGEGLAVTGVVLSTGAALVSALLQSPAVDARGGPATARRAATVLVLALLLVAAVVLVVTVVSAMASANLDAPITLSLIAIAVGGLLIGWMLTRAPLPPLTPRQRVYAIAFWAGSAAVTLAACGELNV